MKIPLSIRQIYDVQLERNQALKCSIDRLLENRIDKRWHYESRVKEIESFALKLETGRFDPIGLEDFFACMIVVENQGKISVAERLIEDIFTIEARKPRVDTETHKRPDSFPFDDLRLYVKLKDDPTLPPSELTDILFEIQIKTFLQHAWSIATHDLAYKGDAPSWATARITYQIKAMLEHAEVSIDGAAILSERTQLKKTDKETDWIIAIVAILKRLWPEDGALPRNLLTLAHNIRNVCAAINITAVELEEIVGLETVQGRGTNITNLSPYGIVVLSVFNQKPSYINKFLENQRSPNLLIPRELELPAPFHSIISTHLVRI